MRYRRKPLIVEAYHWDHGVDFAATAPDWLKGYVTDNKLLIGEMALRLTDWDGFQYIARGDWIVRGAETLLLYKPATFEALYEEVADMPLPSNSSVAEPISCA